MFERFVTCEYTTIDSRGLPITWPVNPYCKRVENCIDITTGLGYPKKANDVRANPKVSLLFSYPKGSGLASPPAVLVQGLGVVDDRDLPRNREQYWRESLEKFPSMSEMLPPKLIQGLFNWYFTRIYVHVHPERVHIWPNGDFAIEPEVYGSGGRGARSDGKEEGEVPQTSGKSGVVAWDSRLLELGNRYPTAVLSQVAPDGSPVSARVPVRVDRESKRVRITGAQAGLPFKPNAACLTAHDHGKDFRWQVNFQVRGDLERDDGDWKLSPRRLVGGFEMPPSKVKQWAGNLQKMIRFRRVARRELHSRQLRSG